MLYILTQYEQNVCLMRKKSKCACWESNSTYRYLIIWRRHFKKKKKKTQKILQNFSPNRKMDSFQKCGFALHSHIFCAQLAFATVIHKTSINNSCGYLNVRVMQTENCAHHQCHWCSGMPMPELLTRASCTKDWKRIFCWIVPHVPLMTLLVKGLNWTEPTFNFFFFPGFCLFVFLDKKKSLSYLDIWHVRIS